MFQVLESRNEGRVHKLNPEKYIFNDRGSMGQKILKGGADQTMDPVAATVKDSFD
jgi:hypothetical protein